MTRVRPVQALGSIGWQVYSRHRVAERDFGGLMDWFFSIVGVLIVLTVVRDVFHTLFHPVGSGNIAPVVMRAVWRTLRLFHSRRRIASLTGPLGVAAVISTWLLASVVGWALIYVAQMPGGYTYGSELDPAGRNEFMDSLYLSLVTVATLGFGDVVPSSPWLRVVVPLEALFGFMLVTAAVSWVLQIYPALHRRRVLALQLSTLDQARRSCDARIESVPVDVLTSLVTLIVESRNDFTQYGATYYFRDLETDASLAASLHYADDLAAEAAGSEDATVRLAGAMLSAAVSHLAGLLAREFLSLGEDSDTASIVEAYATDHGFGAEESQRR
ncbi:putative membrane protein [Mycolicibacterium iranicum]|uniref:Putative membrane protein n=1 Tax=Mycolicibacterium iranicum TaxID=912594 RepID=A0A839QMN4_MYCIR|nr:ion channel [Mycolicibacterium iranicum]MBB2993421.1 putative membrane protein [Mycolicibacterium iranicum]